MVKPFKSKKTGGKERPQDKKDYLLGAVQVSETIPDVFMQDKAWGLPLVYQGKRPACGAHAGVALKMLLDDYESGERYYTPRFTWVDIKTFDGYAFEDGTDMRSILKSLQSAGALDFNSLGNDVTLPDPVYGSANAVTKDMRTQANPRVIGNYGFTNNPSLSQIKQAIYKNKGVLLLMRVGDEFWTAKNGKTSWLEKDILPLRPPTTGLSGHFVMAHSYDANYIYFVNSFSKDWGRKGHGYFGQNYVPYVLEMGTAADISDLIVPNLKQQISLAQKIVDLLKTALSGKK